MQKAIVRMMGLLVVFGCFVYAETQNAILFSWDGTQRKHLEELLAKEKLPVIKMLKNSGGYVEITVKGHGTVTSATHAEMLTGLPPKQNNVYANERYAPIPEGLTIGERLEVFLGKDNIVTVMIMGKINYMGAKGPEELKDAKVPKYLKKGQPYYNAKKNIDEWIGDIRRDDETVIVEALKCIERYKDKRFFMFFHLPDVDVNGHAHGENSPEYENAIINCDTLAGKVIDKLKQFNIYDKTLVYVTADHGFNEATNNHPDAPDVFLATNDKEVKKNGLQADITPTILV